MAGTYIPWIKGLPRRREVFVMANRLKVDRRIIACGCMALWEWCDDEGQFDDERNCRVYGVTRDQLTTIAELDGLVEAMLHTGWIQRGDSDEHWIFPRLGRWVGSSAKERLSGAARQQRHRDRGEERYKSNGDSVTPTVTPTVTEPLPEKRREDKSREEEITKKTSSSSSSLNLDGGVGEDRPDPDGWAAAADLANEVCRLVDRPVPTGGRDRRLIIAASRLALTTLGRDWLMDGVEQTARKRPDNTWGYLRGVLIRQATARGHDLDALLAGLTVPEQYARKEKHERTDGR